jgi:hypothetical protein
MGVTVTGIIAALQTIDKIVEQEKTALQDIYISEVRSRTPIDKGRARRGWQKRSQGKDKIISNKVPYIGRLEDGYSRQASKGFTQQAKTATLNKRKSR